MKEIQTYRADGSNYKTFILDENDLKTVSDYFNCKFKGNKTFLNCMYDVNGHLIAAQVNERTTYDLTAEEVKELFGADSECLK